jgi:hypothetical protein
VGPAVLCEDIGPIITIQSNTRSVAIAVEGLVVVDTLANLFYNPSRNGIPSRTSAAEIDGGQGGSWALATWQHVISSVMTMLIDKGLR